ncbi:MAG TPA: hypothetical protein VGE52_11295 [Pirellulales bacterium]
MTRRGSPARSSARWKRRAAAALEEVMVLGVMVPLGAGLLWYARDVSDLVYGIIRVCVLGPAL